MSEWKTIDTAPRDGKQYLVSRSGQVMVNGILRKPFKTEKGYLRTTIGGKALSIHRLVCSAFVENPKGYGEVNHKDGDKTNNRADNLEWCSRSQNMRHAYAHGLHPGVSLCGEDSPNFGRNGNKHPQSMRVRGVFPDGRVVEYESQGLAATDGFNPAKISLCINGRRPHHRNVVWMPLPKPPETSA